MSPLHCLILIYSMRMWGASSTSGSSRCTHLLCRAEPKNTPANCPGATGSRKVCARDAVPRSPASAHTTKPPGRQPRPRHWSGQIAHHLHPNHQLHPVGPQAEPWTGVTAHCGGNLVYGWGPIWWGWPIMAAQIMVCHSCTEDECNSGRMGFSSVFYI